jgi:hypothetical protein
VYLIKRYTLHILQNERRIFVDVMDFKHAFENVYREPDINPIRVLMEHADLAISLDHSNDLHIMKNRYGSTEALNRLEASKLISKIVANTILDQKETLRFFKGSLEQEILEACDKIFQKWGYRNRKYSYESSFDDIEF